MQHTDFIA